MGAPKSRPRKSTGRTLHPTGTHGLVARHYEPLADGHAGGGPRLVGAFPSTARPNPSSAVASENTGKPPKRLGFALCYACYLISTFAPASSIFFLMASASALLMPSLMGLGAPSTRSLASFSPRLVTSRTALMVFTLFSPAAMRVTVN